MLVKFHINYPTKFGQEIVLDIQMVNEEMSSELFRATKMNYIDGTWIAEVRTNKISKFKYRYRISETHSVDINEAGCDRLLIIPGKDYSKSGGRSEVEKIFETEELLEVWDEWRDYNGYTPFYTKAFTDVLYRRISYKKSFDGDLTFNVFALNLSDNITVVISGNCKTLGDWEISKSKKLNYSGGGLWSITMDKADLPEILEYKFLFRFIDSETIQYTWEEGCNRNYVNDSHGFTVINHNIVHIQIQTPHIAGTAIPVFSLRSTESCGIGDFGDLFKMVDFLSDTSQNILQLLPVNDTTATHTDKDSYPYNSISVFALHPLYLNLKMVGDISDNEFIENFNKEAFIVNSLSKIDYVTTERLKWSYIIKLFDMYGEELLNSSEFELFYKEHYIWLTPYSIFCHLRDRYKTANFRMWPHFSTYDYEETKAFSESDEACKSDIRICYFVQYHLYKQHSHLRDYASKKGVILKGDLPIGISRNSVEAWTEPSLFNFDMQAGAPPDDFSETGQNWGFPTYNWEVMKSDGYMWWRKRLDFMSIFFDAYRIDHILGFFRIWEIPLKFKDGLSGSFNPSYSYNQKQLSQFNLKKSAEEMIKFGLLIKSPRENKSYIPKINARKSNSYKLLDKFDKEAFDNLFNHYYFQNNEKLWSENGFCKLQELLSFTQMLACAEDLGMIPASVPKVLRHFKTLTLDIQRFPKGSGHKFANPTQYPYFSICSTGTHDTSTLKEWLNELEEMGDINRTELGLSDEKKSKSQKEILKELIKINLESPSFATIIPLQDWFNLSDTLSQRDLNEERINIPADSEHIWNYRIHKTIEEITNDNLFKNSVKKMISESGRGLEI